MTVPTDDRFALAWDLAEMSPAILDHDHEFVCRLCGGHIPEMDPDVHPERARTARVPDVARAQHESSCLWLRARRLCGIPPA